MQPLNKASNFSEEEHCYILYAKFAQYVDYLCPSIDLSEEYLGLFESLIDQRAISPTQYPTAVLTHPLTAINPKMQKQLDRMKEIDSQSYFSIVDGTLIQFIYGQNLKYLIIDEKVTLFSTMRYKSYYGEQMIAYYKENS